MERIAGFGGTIGEKGFEDGTLAVIEKARSGNVLAGGISGEFIFQANGIADVESGLGGIEGDFEVDVRRVGGEGLLVLRFEGIPSYCRRCSGKKEQPKQNQESLWHGIRGLQCRAWSLKPLWAGMFSTQWVTQERDSAGTPANAAQDELCGSF